MVIFYSTTMVIMQLFIVSAIHRSILYTLLECKVLHYKGNGGEYLQLSML